MRWCHAAWILLFGATPAAAFGTAGHAIVGQVAAKLLCPDASRAVAQLLDGESLAEAGQWPDTIRSLSAWAHTGPWHYINLADQAELAERRATGAEDDVLWAIEFFSARLARADLPRARRAEALRFVAHFIADVHQPLHVGLAGDRGGNTLSVQTGDGPVSLHGFWDTTAVRLAGRSAAAYAQQVLPAARALGTAESDIYAWAAEGLALRPQVYAFEAAPTPLASDYQEMARQVTERQITLAAVRLAQTLNAVFCD